MSYAIQNDILTWCQMLKDRYQKGVIKIDKVCHLFIMNHYVLSGCSIGAVLILILSGTA